MADGTSIDAGQQCMPVERWVARRDAAARAGSTETKRPRLLTRRCDLARQHGLVPAQAGHPAQLPYPGPARLQPLLEFAGSARQWLPPGRAARLRAFVLQEYSDGRSLRQIAELADRSFSEIRKVLADAGVRRRPVGAPPAYPTRPT